MLVDIAAASKHEKKRSGDFARIASFGHHRDKLGAGYTYSLQAMNCVSRALPDLHCCKRKFKQSAATKAAKHMQPLFIPLRGTRGSGGKLST